MPVAWRPFALGGVAAAVAAVVLVIGRPSTASPGSLGAGGWETLHETPAEAARVRVVDDPRLDGIASASLASLDPLQGP